MYLECIFFYYLSNPEYHTSSSSYYMFKIYRYHRLSACSTPFHPQSLQHSYTSSYIHCSKRITADLYYYIVKKHFSRICLRGCPIRKYTSEIAWSCIFSCEIRWPMKARSKRKQFPRILYNFFVCQCVVSVIQRRTMIQIAGLKKKTKGIWNICKAIRVEWSTEAWSDLFHLNGSNLLERV